MNNINPPGFYQGQVLPQGQQQPPQQQAPQQPSMPGIQTNMPMPQNPNIPINPGIIQNPISFQSDSDIVNDALVDPISKCKELFVQLKNSLKLLLNQLALVLNPPSENSVFQTDNQYQLLGKYVENFNRVCDLLIVNLRVACEAHTISAELKTMGKYYAHMGPMDANKAENPFISSINIQMQRINEFRSLFYRFLNNNSSTKQMNPGENLI